ncbi:MAG: HAMP domain-containing histidine kinase [Erysipelotrichaceae bacterium]|nr:HAMP domain-containing histidine kinase [Erysipelotrichaceae bacterium]
MGIVRKQFLIVSGMMILTITSILTLLYFGIPIYYNQLKEIELKREFIKVVTNLENKSLDEIFSRLKIDDEKQKNIFFTVIDADGNIIYPNVENTETIKNELEELNNQNFDQVGVWSYLIVTKSGENIVIQGEYAFNSLSNLSGTLITFYPFVLIVIISLTSFAAYVYSHLSTKRIKYISKTTKEMQKLEEGIECKIAGDDEISFLATNINNLYKNLLTTIKELEKEKNNAIYNDNQKSEFLRITSHELKTPIASMIGLIEGMMYNIGDFKNHEVYLKKCREILDEQAILVQSILDATNSSIIKNNQEQFMLNELILENLNFYNTFAKIKNYDFSVNMQPLKVSANKIYILKAIKNILDNAFRYTKQNGLIKIIIKGNCLTIENQAEYFLNKNELEQIFNPFYRPDFSRSKKDGGSGMGLYLVKQILETHNYTYEFKNIDNNFMQFNIWFNTAD